MPLSARSGRSCGPGPTSVLGRKRLGGEVRFLIRPLESSRYPGPHRMRLCSRLVAAAAAVTIAVRIASRSGQARPVTCRSIFDRIDG